MKGVKRVFRDFTTLPFIYSLFGLIYLLVFYLGQKGTVLGLRGTGSWTADERPKNYRELILLLFPNSPLSLTALMSKLQVRATNDPEFKIFTKNLPTQRVIVSGSQTSGDLAIETQGSGASIALKKGHSLINERTLEVIWVTADPTTPFNSFAAVRGKGSTAAAMNDGDGLLIVGSHHQEGAAVPTAITFEPSLLNNFTQIFRTALHLTNTAKATNLRTGSDLEERQRETLEIHAIEREMAYVFGTGVEDTSGAQPERTTKGFISLVTTNVKDFAGAVDIDSWESFMEDVFEDGSSEKLLLAGNTAITNINKVARIHGEIQMTPMSETYGMMLDRYRTPYGFLQIRQHPLFSKNATFRTWGIVVDPEYLADRILSGNSVNRDTNYLENRQNAGDDATKDEWLTESGLELDFDTCNAVFKNASSFVP